MTELWAWARCKDSERWSGPFGSKEEAISAGREASGDYDEETGVTPGSFVVAPAKYPDSGEFVAGAFDMEDLLDRADERAVDEGYFCEDGPAFEIKSSGNEPEVELLAALMAWAEKWVKATTFTVDVDQAEEITPSE